MIDPLLAIGVALLGGGLAPLAPAWCALAAVGVALLLRPRLGSVTLALAAGAALVGAARSRATLDEGLALHRAVVDELGPPTRCEGVATVLRSPVVVGRAARSADDGPAGRIDVALDHPRCGGRTLGALRARLFGAPEQLGRGDRVAVVADLAPIHLFWNEGSPDPRPRLARSGVAASGGVVDLQVVSRGGGIRRWIDAARAAVRARIEATYHPEAAALGRALVLGENDLDSGDDEAFRSSGLAHLLAVSGTHLVLVVLGFAGALRAVLVRVPAVAERFDVGRAAALVAVPVACAYGDFAGGGGSVARATGMLAVVLVARGLGRRPTAQRSLGLTLAVAALADPLVACDVSFALSTAATAGLLALGPWITGALRVLPKALRRLTGTLSATIAASVGCAPLLLLLGPSLPLLSVAANAIAAPLGEIVALPVCLAHALLGWFPAAERGAAVVGSGALLLVRAVARTTAGVREAQLTLPTPTAAQLAAVVVGAAAAWSRRGRARGLAAAATAAAWLLAEVVAARQGAPRGELRVTAVDVGQGDALLVDLPDGRAMLVDGGGFVGSPVDPGTRALAPLLRARRRSRLDVVVLSHPHPDHFGGLASLLPTVDVGELWDTGQGEAEGAGPTYAALLAGLARRGVPVRRPGELCGRPRDFGGARVAVLAPCPSFVPDRGANDNSFVVSVTFGARRALLVGDSEHEAEHEILGRGAAELRADLLKVGHHGSRTSTTPAFLAAVGPSLAVVSCGVRNRFGHPHPQTLATLARAGVPLLRTDRGGAVVWRTDGETIEVEQQAIGRVAPRPAAAGPNRTRGGSPTPSRSHDE